MNQIPLTTSTSSGTSFAMATVSTRPTPRRTPRTLTVASSAKSAAISAPRPTGVETIGHIVPTEPANALATDATAKVAIRKYSTPARNPTNVPKATST
jgi:hypothetical protein